MVSLSLLLVLIVTSLWTILILRSAIVSLHASGKTYEQQQGIKSGYSWLQRLLIVHVKDSTAGTPKYNKYRGTLEKVLFGYIVASVFIWLLVIIGVFVSRFNVIVTVLLAIKVVLVDVLAAGFYLKTNVERDTVQKTLHWKWSKK